MNLFRWFQRSSATSTSTGPVPKAPPAAASTQVTVAVVAPGDLVKPGQPIYPPVDNGILVRPGSDLVASQHELIARLRRHASLPAAEFETRYLDPIRRLADFVGLLPASDGRHHSGAGGLFAYALHMGFLAARSADGLLFAPSETPELRRQVEAAWRHGTFLTALSCDLYKALLDMQVVTPKGATWSPYLGGMTNWARGEGAERIYVRWIKPRAGGVAVPGRGTSAWALNAIAGNDLLGALHAVRPEIVATMTAIVTGTMGPLTDHPMARALNSARKSALELDEALHPQLYGKLTHGAHLEPLLVDCMRILISSGRWSCNKGKSVLQYGTDGLFLVWPAGAKHISDELDSRKVEGVPNNAASLADILLAGGIVVKAPDGSPYHNIRCGDEGFKDQKLVALRVVRPDSLIADVHGEILVSAAKYDLLGSDKPSQKPEAVSAGGLSEVDQSGSGDESGPEPAEAVPTAAPAPAASGSAEGAAAAPATPKRQQKQKAAAASPATHLQPGFTPPPRAAMTEGAPLAAPISAPAQSEEVAASSLAPATTDSGGPPDGIPNDLVVLLGVPLARAIARFRDAYNTSRASSSITKVASGIAIDLTYALDHSGLAPDRFQEPLKKNGFLVMTDPADGGRSRPLHVLEVNGAEIRAYILSTKFASRCGFVLN